MSEAASDSLGFMEKRSFRSRIADFFLPCGSKQYGNSEEVLNDPNRGRRNANEASLAFIEKQKEKRYRRLGPLPAAQDKEMRRFPEEEQELDDTSWLTRPHRLGFRSKSAVSADDEDEMQVILGSLSESVASEKKSQLERYDSKRSTALSSHTNKGRQPKKKTIQDHYDMDDSDMSLHLSDTDDDNVSVVSAESDEHNEVMKYLLE